MNKLTSLAVAVLATSSMLSAAQAVTVTPTFGGYLRAGLDRQQHGKFKSWNVNKVGRLGNESDIWAELALGANISGATDAVFGVQTRLVYTNENGCDQEKTPKDDNFKNAYLDEVYATAKNVFSFSKEATIWAGKRYYHREQTEIMDYKWYQIEGYGAGIEYIDVGPGKLSFAWFDRTDPNMYYTDQLKANNKGYAKIIGDDGNKIHGEHWDSITTEIDTEKFDLEYALAPWDGAWLNLRSTLLVPQQDDNNYMKLVDKPNIRNGKIFAASLGTSYGIGYCTTVAQYIAGPNTGDPFGNGNWIQVWSPENSNNAHRWQFLNYGDMKIGDFGLAHSMYYTAGTFAGTDGKKESDKAFSFAVRPYYKLTDVTKIAAELGFFTQSEKYKDGSNNVNYKGQKATLAYVLSPDAGDWKSRPELRFYVTYLHCNDAQALAGSPSQDKQVDIYTNTDDLITSYAPRGNQVIVGAQMEAWW